MRMRSTLSDDPGDHQVTERVVAQDVEPEIVIDAGESRTATVAR